MQRPPHLCAALIGRLALAHDQHLRHAARHATVELADGLAAAAFVAGPRRARLQDGHQVQVADGVADADRQAVQAGASAVVNCVTECISRLRVDVNERGANMRQFTVVY